MLIPLPVQLSGKIRWEDGRPYLNKPYSAEDEAALQGYLKAVKEETKLRIVIEE